MIFKWDQVLLFACIWIMLGKVLLFKLCLYRQKQKARPDPHEVKNLTSVKFYTIEKNRPNQSGRTLCDTIESIDKLKRKP